MDIWDNWGQEAGPGQTFKFIDPGLDKPPAQLNDMPQAAPPKSPWDYTAGVTMNDRPQDFPAASEPMPQPPNIWQGDPSGFVNAGMETLPFQQILPFAQIQDRPPPQVPQSLGLMDASATANIPELRNQDLLRLLGIFSLGGR